MNFNYCFIYQVVKCHYYLARRDWTSFSTAATENGLFTRLQSINTNSIVSNSIHTTSRLRQLQFGVFARRWHIVTVSSRKMDIRDRILSATWFISIVIRLKNLRAKCRFASPLVLCHLWKHHLGPSYWSYLLHFPAKPGHHVTIPPQCRRARHGRQDDTKPGRLSDWVLEGQPTTFLHQHIMSFVAEATSTVASINTLQTVLFFVLTIAIFLDCS